MRGSGPLGLLFRAAGWPQTYCENAQISLQHFGVPRSTDIRSKIELQDWAIFSKASTRARGRAKPVVWLIGIVCSHWPTNSTYPVTLLAYHQRMAEIAEELDIG